MLTARDRAVRNEFMALALLADAPQYGRAGTEVVVGANTSTPPYFGSVTRVSNVFYQTYRRLRGLPRRAGNRNKATYVLNLEAAANT